MTLIAYLKIDDIPGEATSEGHEEEIDIHGLNWAVDAPAASGRRRAAQPKVRPLKLHKYTDKASPYLTLACLRRQSFPEMTLTVRANTGDAIVDYLVFKLENCTILRHVMENGDEDDARIHELLSIGFETITETYDTGRSGDAGEEHEIQYNIVSRA